MATHTVQSPYGAAQWQAQFDAATEDGAIVECSATGGAVGWTAGASWSAPPNAILRGAGTAATGGGDQTVIQDNYASGSPLLSITVSGTGVFRMTGITVQSGSGASTKDFGTVVIAGPGTASNVVVDHCHFSASLAVNYKIFRAQPGIFGVMYECVIDLWGTRALYFYNGRGTVGNGEWATATNFGSNEYFFIEDCVINGADKQCRLYDGNDGAKVVVRFNNLVNCCLVEDHATGHASDDRGPRAKEIYGNYCTSTIVGVEPNEIGVGNQSGACLAWGNSLNQVYKKVFGFQVIRKNSATYAQSPTPGGWGYAGGAPIATGTVNVTGTAVTWVSGDTFDTGWPAGTMIYIAGMTAEGVSGQEPADGPSGGIASVNSTTSITLANGGQLGSPLTGATYTVGSAWDGNTGSNHDGYPAIDQPGRGQGDLLTGSFPSKVNSTTGTVAWPNQALEPIYHWANVGSFVSGWGGSAQYSNAAGTRMAANRDYYEQAGGIQTSATSPFNGTVGCGWGTIANRPTTCTVGVAYWAIDEGSWNQSSSNPYGVQQNGASGKMYVCLATNVWTASYGAATSSGTAGEPYTYPHPLRGPTGNTLTASGTTTVSGLLTLP